MIDAVDALGGVDEIKSLFFDFQNNLYEKLGSWAWSAIYLLRRYVCNLLAGCFARHVVIGLQL